MAGGHEYISGLGQGKKWFQHFKGFSLRLKMSCLQGQLAAHSLAKPWRSSRLSGWPFPSGYEGTLQVEPAGSNPGSTGCHQPWGWWHSVLPGFADFQRGAPHTSSSLRGSWRSTAACSSSVSSLSDRMSSPANVDKVAARSRDSTWQKNLNQDSHVWHNRAFASKRNTPEPLSDVRCQRRRQSESCHCVEEPWCGIGHSQQTMFNECKLLLFSQRMQVTVLRRYL